MVDVEIYKEFKFEAAHRLINVPPTHKCARLHGHSYRVRVYLEGPLDPHTGWVMDFADLTPLADRQMAKLSKGMSQRLCFGRMLVPDPELMILDEPAAGLDPKARLEFKNLVRLLAARGRSEEHTV